MSPDVLNITNYTVLDPCQIMDMRESSAERYSLGYMLPKSRVSKEPFLSDVKPMFVLFSRDICTLVDRLPFSPLFKDVVKYEMKVHVPISDNDIKEYTVGKDSEMLMACIPRNDTGLTPTEITNNIDKISAYSRYRLHSKITGMPDDSDVERIHNGKSIPRWGVEASVISPMHKEKIFKNHVKNKSTPELIGRMVSKENFDTCNLYNSKNLYKQKLIAENKVLAYLERNGITGGKFAFIYQTYQHSSFYGMELKESKVRSYQPDWQSKVNRAVCRNMAITNIPNYVKLKDATNNEIDELANNGQRGWASDTPLLGSITQSPSEMFDAFAWASVEKQSDYTGHDFDRGFIQCVDFIPTNVNDKLYGSRKLAIGPNAGIFGNSKVNSIKLVIKATSSEYRKSNIFFNFIEHV